MQVVNGWGARWEVGGSIDVSLIHANRVGESNRVEWFEVWVEHCGEHGEVDMVFLEELMKRLVRHEN